MWFDLPLFLLFVFFSCILNLELVSKGFFLFLFSLITAFLSCRITFLLFFSVPPCFSPLHPACSFCQSFLLFTDVFLLLFLSVFRAAFLSPPSAGISFSPDSSPVGTSLLSHALLALLFQETQPAGKGTACLSPLRGDPLKSQHPLCLPDASCCAWMRAGDLGKEVSRSLLLPAPFSLCLDFAAELGDFFLPPAARSSAPRCFPSTRGESGNLLALLRNARCAGAAGCCREERLRGRQAQSQNSSEMGREMRWLT